MAAAPPSTTTKTVLISGANGDTGRPAVRESIGLGLTVRALVHRVDERAEALADLGAEVVEGDLLDINTVRPAMEGVDAAYFVWPVQPGLLHAIVNFAQAAKEAGVGTVINLSQRSANRWSTSDSCRDSVHCRGGSATGPALDVVHLRPTYFLEWLLYPWQLPYLQQRRLTDARRQRSALADRRGRPRPRHRCASAESRGAGRHHHPAVRADRDGPRADGGRVVCSSGQEHRLSGPARRRNTLSLSRAMGIPPYVVQHLSGAMVDYQNGHMSGSDNNIEQAHWTTTHDRRRVRSRPRRPPQRRQRQVIADRSQSEE